MMDEMFDRGYQAGRQHLNAGIDRVVHRLGAALSNTFKTLRRLQFDAPWAVKGSDPGCS
jgi:hypothetical protein